MDWSLLWLLSFLAGGSAKAWVIIGTALSAKMIQICWRQLMPECALSYWWMRNIDRLISERLTANLWCFRAFSDIRLQSACVGDAGNVECVISSTLPRYPHRTQTAVWTPGSTMHRHNSHFFLMCKRVLQCSHRPLGADIISLALELCMTLISSPITATYQRHPV